MADGAEEGTCHEGARSREDKALPSEEGTRKSEAAARRDVDQCKGQTERALERLTWGEEEGACSRETRAEVVGHRRLHPRVPRPDRRAEGEGSRASCSRRGRKTQVRMRRPRGGGCGEEGRSSSSFSSEGLESLCRDAVCGTMSAMR